MKTNKINIVFAIISLMIIFACNENEPLELYNINNCDCIDEEKHTYDSVTDIDLNTYRTVIIGTQEWMAENLKVITYNDGTPIFNKINEDWGSDTSAAYCWYNNNEVKYKSQYGALYNWYAVETDKLCPVGWHTPSTDEWNELIDFISTNGKLTDAEIAKKLMAPRCWYENSTPINVGTDDYGFSALGGGERVCGSCDNEFIGLNTKTLWWSSSESTINEPVGSNLLQAWCCYMSPIPIGTNYTDKYIGLSVRCIKD